MVPLTPLQAGIVILSGLMAVQGIFTLFLMIYAWDNPEEIDLNTSPIQYYKPYFSFSALIPAYHESDVICDTIQSIANIGYPADLSEIIVICHKSDIQTITTIENYIRTARQTRVQIVLFDAFPVTKAHALNIGLQKAHGDIIGVFDAEDEPHPDIYQIVNTTMLRDQADVIQSGVQLMNYRSSWFSTLNVLEYFFWFKSALHFFSKVGVVPLGGNTIFIKKYLTDYIGGWNNHALTEDADIGIRLSNARVKVRVVYDERHVTREETPPTMASFIRQRTRWNQGFLQILTKLDWLKLPTGLQRLFALYILGWPLIQSIFFLYLIAAFVMAFTIMLPASVVIISLIPAYLLLLQLMLLMMGILEFVHDFKLQSTIWMPIKILCTFIPFYLLLGISAVRAIIRAIINDLNWEKTPHINAHRRMTKRLFLNS